MFYFLRKENPMAKSRSRTDGQPDNRYSKTPNQAKAKNEGRIGRPKKNK